MSTAAKCSCTRTRDTLIAVAAPAVILGFFALVARALSGPMPAEVAPPGKPE